MPGPLQTPQLENQCDWNVAGKCGLCTAQHSLSRLRSGSSQLQAHGHRSWREHWTVLRFYWPRLLVTCLGWVANDFAVRPARMR